MIETIITLSLLIIVLIYIISNLVKKEEKYEDILKEKDQELINYKSFIKDISETINDSNEKIKIIDSKGSFQSDDEVGFFFKNLKQIQEQLNKFNINDKS